MTAANPPADSAAAVPPADAAPDPRRWLILAVIALAQLMIVLDATVVNIALPSAQRSLHFTTVDRQWVVTAYALAFGSLLLLGGRVSSLVGRKVTFLSGLIGFAAASAVGGAATSFGMLVAARACQGAFGAFMAPSALSLLTTTFSGSKDRGKAFGVFGAIAGAGGAIGLLLGGVLTEYLSWRWCLYVNLFFAAIAVTGGAILLGRHPRSGHPRLDIPGAAFVSSGMFCIVYGFSNAATHSWHTALEPTEGAGTESPRGHRPLLPLENSSRTVHGSRRYPVQRRGISRPASTPGSSLAARSAPRCSTRWPPARPRPT